MLVSGPLACVGDALALVGEVVAFISSPLALVGVVLGPVQGRGPLGQPGLGRLQGLLGLPGPCLSRSNPGFIDRQRRDPFPLGRLDDFLG